MHEFTPRCWIAVLLPALVAAVVGALFVHLLTHPNYYEHLSAYRTWSFENTLQMLIPTLIAMSFAYRLSVAPYVCLHTRRSAILLSFFVTLILACGVFIAGVAVGFLVYPEFAKSIFINIDFRFLSSPTELPWHTVVSLRVLAVLIATTAAMVVMAGLVASKSDSILTYPVSGNKGMNALLGILLITSFSVPDWCKVLREAKREGDRAGCIMNIRNVQVALRSYESVNGINPGELPGISKSCIVGPGKFIDHEPVCPSGGTYRWTEGHVPEIGELMLRCSCSDHTPVSYETW